MRKHPRINTDHRYKVRITVDHHKVEHIKVISVGLFGCAVRLDKKEEGWLDITYLEKVQVLHPDLPEETLEARVVWMQENLEHPELMDVGLEFLSPSDLFLECMAAHITNIAGYVKKDNNLY